MQSQTVHSIWITIYFALTQSCELEWVGIFQQNTLLSLINKEAKKNICATNFYQ